MNKKKYFANPSKVCKPELKRQLEQDNRSLRSKLIVKDNEELSRYPRTVMTSAWVADMLGIKNTKEVAMNAKIQYLLHKDVLNVTPKHPEYKNRDRLIVTSKEVAASVVATKVLVGYDVNINKLKRNPIAYIEGENTQVLANGIESPIDSIYKALGLSLYRSLVNKRYYTDQLNWKPFNWSVYLLMKEDQITKPQIQKALTEANALGLKDLKVIIPSFDKKSVIKYQQLWTAGFHVVETTGKKFLKDITKDVDKPTIFIVRELFTEKEEAFFNEKSYRTVKEISEFYDVQPVVDFTKKHPSEELLTLRTFNEKRTSLYYKYWNKYFKKMKQHSFSVKDFADLDLNKIEYNNDTELIDKLMTMADEAQDIRVVFDKTNMDKLGTQIAINIDVLKDPVRILQIINKRSNFRIFSVKKDGDLSNLKKLLETDKLEGQVIISRFENTKAGHNAIEKAVKTLSKHENWNILLPGTAEEAVEAFKIASRNTKKSTFIGLTSLDTLEMYIHPDKIQGKPQDGLYQLRKRSNTLRPPSHTIVASGPSLHFANAITWMLAEANPQLFSWFNLADNEKSQTYKEVINRQRPIIIKFDSIKEDYQISRTKKQILVKINFKQKDNIDVARQIANKLLKGGK